MANFRIGILTSAWDRAAIDLVQAVRDNVQSGRIPDAEIAFVLVTRDEGETYWGDAMIWAVHDMGLPLVTFSSHRFEIAERFDAADALKRGDPEPMRQWRLAHDRELMKLLPPTDLDVLLGYMWWAGKEMCWLRTMINLHPALPGGPKGTYRDVIWELIRSNATEAGVMIHLVTPELDEGPAIAYCRYPIRGGEFDLPWRVMNARLAARTSLESIRAAEGERNTLFDVIRREGVARELPLIVEAIKLVAEGKVSVILDSWVISWTDGYLENGYDLTDAVNLAVRSGKENKDGR